VKVDRVIVFRPLEPGEGGGALHCYVVGKDAPLYLGAEAADEETRGLCHACRATLTQGDTRLLRAAAATPVEAFLVLVCGACGAQNATARSAARLLALAAP
jgi:hypothetical protein